MQAEGDQNQANNPELVRTLMVYGYTPEQIADQGVFIPIQRLINGIVDRQQFVEYFLLLGNSSYITPLLMAALLQRITKHIGSFNLQDIIQFVSLNEQRRPNTNLLQQIEQNLSYIKQSRFSGEEYDPILGKRDPNLPFLSTEAITDLLPGQINPFNYRKPNVSQRLKEVEASQVEQIINQMEQAIGSREKTNYFKLREAATRAKWQAIIDFLKSVSTIGK